MLNVYRERQIDWSLLALEGEESLDILSPTSAPELGPNTDQPQCKGPKVFLNIKALTALLEDVTGLSRALPLRIIFDTGLFKGTSEISMNSPILWTGKNGLGKSTLVHLLAGARNAESGSFGLRVGGYKGHVRAVFQECTTQLFGQEPLGYLESVFREAGDALKSANEEYQLLERQIRDRLMQRQSNATIGSADRPDTLLQAKIALTAARLQKGTILLVLDEPGFGLSQSAATIFVEVVSARCAELNIALLVISHVGNWYQRIFETTLQADVTEASDGMRYVRINPKPHVR
jgi:energy-coupling factor transporter ATP-binding protein EcfA2